LGLFNVSLQKDPPPRGSVRVRCTGWYQLSNFLYGVNSEGGDFTQNFVVLRSNLTFSVMTNFTALPTLTRTSSWPNLVRTNGDRRPLETRRFLCWVSKKIPRCAKAIQIKLLKFLRWTRKRRRHVYVVLRWYVAEVLVRNEFWYRYRFVIPQRATATMLAPW